MGRLPQLPTLHPVLNSTIRRYTHPMNTTQLIILILSAACTCVGTLALALAHTYTQRLRALERRHAIMRAALVSLCAQCTKDNNGGKAIRDLLRAEEF